MTASPAPTGPPDPTGSSTTSAPVRLQARRPDDLLALVPYLLGFAPAESLVAVLVRDGTVLLSARMDLPSGPPAATGPELATTVQELVDQHDASSVVVVAYSTDRDRGALLLQHVLDALTQIDVADALLVDGARWWSLTCTSGCCPSEGAPYEPERHRFAAEAVYAGLTTSGSRTEVEALVSGPEPALWGGQRELARELRPALRRAGARRREAAMAEAVVAAVRVASVVAGSPGTGDAGPVPDARACVRLALLAREVRVRDVACALITREQADVHLALWRRVVSRVPPELAPAPLCLLGVAAWAAGNGTLLNCCCTRVQTLDASYPMGRLLADVSARALPPSLWDALAAELRADLGLVVG